MEALPRDTSSGYQSSIKRYLIEHYDELHDMAARQMAGENIGNSMQATALMNEAVCQMLNPDKNIKINDSRHFLANANIMMKHILIDQARRREALARGGHLQRQELHGEQVGIDDQHVELLILQEEIQLLAKRDPLAAQVIQKRCEGHSIEEAAEILNLSRTQAYDLWRFARAWLLQIINESSTKND